MSERDVMTSAQFRERCLVSAQGQLAILLTEFQGMSGHPLRFDILQVDKLRSSLAEVFALFIDSATVEEVDAELRSLLDQDVVTRTTVIAGERERLSLAGLTRLVVPATVLATGGDS